MYLSSVSAPEDSWTGQAAARPAGVPEAARWSEDHNEWQSSATDALGRLDGPYRSWRPDGTLSTIARYRAGKSVDVTWRFHPDGSLFSVGAYVEGAPRGAHHRYATTDEQGERLQSCCVPAGAWQLRQRFRDDGTVDNWWFDRDGVRLLESGAPYPERPAGVPPEASFNENTQTWEAGLRWAQQGFSGTRRRWARNGVLRLIETLVDGKRHGPSHCFDEAGAPAWDAEYVADRLSGPFRDYQVPRSHFVDAGLTAYTGTFAEDQAVGTWRLLRADGSLGDERDLGVASSDDSLALVLIDQTHPEGYWKGLAATALQTGRLNEGFLAMARAAAVSGDAAELMAALKARALPLHPDAARSGAAELLGRAADNLVALVDGLRRGWDAPALLLGIAKALPDRDRVALDLAKAAVLLAPDEPGARATRALLHGSLGEPAAARREIEAVRAGAAEQAEFLELYLRAYFPAYDFWPSAALATHDADGGGATSVADGPIQLLHDAAEVREVVWRYATRLARLQTMVVARLQEADSVVLPDLGALLPDGPAPLSQWTFTMSEAEYGGKDEAEALASSGEQRKGEDGEEALSEIEISVDETHGLDLESAPLLRILRRIRADWAGLTWLCWAVGLDHVGYPQQVSPPPQFARQAILTMERTWRCNDRLNTHGLLALTKGVASFDWEGTSIDLVPEALVDVALEEYLERRAVFAWLCDPINRSPWQDDLRTDG